jgi:Tfp pilus assembly protein PilP
MKERSNNMKKSGFFFIICSIALFLIITPFCAERVYCAESTKEIKPSIPAIKNYSYRWAGKPDPFQPFIETDLMAKKKAAEQATRAASLLPISPLQRLDLSAVRVVGIAGDNLNRKAVIEDNHKKFYPIQVGTYLGTNNGIIKEILADRVIVEEKTTEQGKIKVILITMKLHSIKDEGKP